MKFEFSGEFNDRKSWKKFKKIVEGKTENHAKQKLITIIGSKHNCKKRFIKINEVKEVQE